MSASSGPPNGIGQSVRRKEDFRLLTGRGRYGDDLALPRMVHAAFVRSPHAHARIRSMDKTAALAVPGALTVLAGADYAFAAASDSILASPAIWNYMERNAAQKKDEQQMDSIVTVEHIRQHVLEDAADLISLVGLLDPVVIASRLKDADDIAHASRLLRKLLSRDLILILCRLHEIAERGPTGITASIDSLLNFASADIGAIGVSELKEKRKQVIADLEAQGTKFKDLRAFRTAEIAHSLHRVSRETDNSLYYSSIAQFATQTYNLILEIEQELALVGFTPFSDLRDMLEAWPRRGIVFWNKALNP